MNLQGEGQIWTIYKNYLVVFTVVQNFVVIDAVVFDKGTARYSEGSIVDGGLVWQAELTFIHD